MKKKVLTIVLILITHLSVFSAKEEVMSNITSSFVIQKDSFSSNYKKAKELFEKEKYGTALKIALKNLENTNSDEIVATNQLIANIFFATRSYRNAIGYNRRVLTYFKEFNEANINAKLDTLSNKNIILTETLLGIGNSYYRLSSKDGDRKYRDSAFYFYNKVSGIEFQDKGILQLKSRAYNNMSAIYINDGLYKKAKKYLFKSIEIHKKLKDKVNEAATLSNLSSIYLLENNYVKAKKTYFEALDLIRNVKTKKALEVRENLYFNLAYNLYMLKDYKAYDYQELSYNIKDSLRDKEVRKIIEELDAEYDFNSAKKLLLKEEENKHLKAQRTFTIYGVGSLIVILVLLFVLNYYKLRQKNLRLKLSKTELLQNQQIERIRSEAQVRILNATIDGKEEERKQISETLHDNVSALLSSASLHLQASKTQFDGNIPVEIDKTSRIISEASEKIRDLSHTLVSSVLLKFGLSYAIRDIVEKYSNSQIKFTTDIDGLGRYHQKLEIKIYNIIQELINNILKHSEAKNANITMREKRDKICVFVSDDGKGFDKAKMKITKRDGLGINQIDARIQMMKGRFHIDSQEGRGTKIEVELPISEK